MTMSNPPAIGLDFERLSKRDAKLVIAAQKNTSCNICFRNTHIIWNLAQEKYMQPNFGRLRSHLIAQHGYDPRPWYKRLLAARLTTK